MLVIVPNELRDAINAKLDKAIAECPGAEIDRQELFRQLLTYYNDHGVIPDFSVKPKED